MSSTTTYQEKATEKVGLTDESVPVIVWPNGQRLEFPGCRAYKMIEFRRERVASVPSNRYTQYIYSP